MNIINAANWYIGALAWIWLAFPLMHGPLKSLFSSRIWAKMFFINVLSVVLIYPFSGFNIFTLCTVPLLRLGEFAIGCGAACALNKLEQGAESTYLTKLQWTPAALIFVYITVLYSILALPHGWDLLCLHERKENKKCSLWGESVWIETQPPCLLVWDKYFNKYAFLWAVVIYTVASAEKSNDQGAFMRLLGHEAFKSLSTFSLSLYLGHSSIDWMLISITDSIGWMNFWHDDVRLLMVYALCYLLHLFTIKITSFVFKPAIITPPQCPLQNQS
jgi:hypothetical protein